MRRRGQPGRKGKRKGKGETHLSHKLLLLRNETRLSLDAQQQRQPDQQRARASDPRRTSNLANRPLGVPLCGFERVRDGRPGGRGDDVLEGGEALTERLLRGVVEGELRVFLVVEVDVRGDRGRVGPVVFVDFLDLNPVVPVVGSKERERGKSRR